MHWYRKQARDLSWRGTTDPYAVWVSEIVLQQTRVEQGTPYIERFMKRFPTVEKLARANEDSVLKLWEGLGYYSRARNLHKAAKIVALERNGEFPGNAAAWEELPGIGRYTAGAIASIALNERVPVVDGNVKRVLSRVMDHAESIDSQASTALCWEWMTKLVDGTAPGTFNQSVMELGANVCTPKQPHCDACPVSLVCRAYRNGTQSQRPVRTPKKKVPHHQIVIGAIQRNGEYLLGKRKSDGFLGGLWEFPGGKIEANEKHEEALHREVGEELSIKLKSADYLTSVDHAYSHFKVTLHVYVCTANRARPKTNVHTELRWVNKKNFGKLAFPKANHKFLKLLP